MYKLSQSLLTKIEKFGVQSIKTTFFQSTALTVSILFSNNKEYTTRIYNFNRENYNYYAEIISQTIEEKAKREEWLVK